MLPINVVLKKYHPYFLIKQVCNKCLTSVMTYDYTNNWKEIMITKSVLFFRAPKRNKISRNTKLHSDSSYYQLTFVSLMAMKLKQFQLNENIENYVSQARQSTFNPTINKMLLMIPCEITVQFIITSPIISALPTTAHHVTQILIT